MVSSVCLFCVEVIVRVKLKCTLSEYSGDIVEACVRRAQVQRPKHADRGQGGVHHMSPFDAVPGSGGSTVSRATC